MKKITLALLVFTSSFTLASGTDYVCQYQLNQKITVLITQNELKQTNVIIDSRQMLVPSKSLVTNIDVTDTQKILSGKLNAPYVDSEFVVFINAADSTDLATKGILQIKNIKSKPVQIPMTCKAL